MQPRAGMICSAVLIWGLLACQAAAQSALPSGPGLAANYFGDAGVKNHPSVVFVENFETGTLQDIADNWGFARHLDQMALTNDVPDGSSGSRSLRMTATPQKQGVEMYKTFTGAGEGWEQIFLRFNVKFAEDYPRNHHFVALRGIGNPSPVPGVGTPGAGQLAHNYYSITMEPPFPGDTWFFYSYWPEMRSWQTETGEPDGRPQPYFGNNLRPETPVSSPRGEWLTVEMMVKLNTNPSDPDNRDGELAFWINGELAAHFAPGTPKLGYWRRDSWNYGTPPSWLTAMHGIEAGEFEGFRFRTEEMENVLINVLRLQNYVSGDFIPATVWFDNIVMATEYIGPMNTNPIPEPASLGLLGLAGLLLGRRRRKQVLVLSQIS